MKLVFTKVLAKIAFRGVVVDGSALIEVDGELITLKLGERFSVVSDMSVTAPKHSMEHIRKAYVQAGFIEKAVN